AVLDRERDRERDGESNRKHQAGAVAEHVKVGPACFGLSVKADLEPGLQLADQAHLRDAEVADAAAAALLPAAGIRLLTDDRGVDRADDFLDLLALAAPVEESQRSLQLGVDVPDGFDARFESGSLLGPVEGRLRLGSRSVRL